MRFRARFTRSEAERSREIEVRSGSPEAEVGLDGKTGTYDAVTTNPGTWSIVGPTGRHADVTVHREGDGALQVHVGSSSFSFELVDDLTARALAAAGKRAVKRGGDVKTAIPGRVLRVLASPGDVVEKGRPLIVLEAMKMENEVRSPRDGKIRSIEVVPGQAVAAGEVLVRFEEDA